MRENRRPRVILGVLVLVALSLVLIDLRADANGPLGQVKSLTGAAFGPIERATSSITSPIRGFVTNLTGGGEKEAQISALEAEVAQLRAAGASPETARRLGEMNDLLRMSRAGQYKIMPANVIAEGATQGFGHTLTLDVGSRDGVTADMTVLAVGGLAGHVVSVSRTSSVVVLLTDATVSIGGRLEGAGEIGFVTGKGSETQMDFQLLDPYGALEIGDRVVTFGSKGGGPFVPGVPIGQIVDVSGTPGQLTRMATLRPYVNPSTVNVVGVVLEPPRENPRDAVLMDRGSGVTIPRSLPIPTVGQATPMPTGSAAPNDAPAPSDTPSTPVTPTPRAPTGDGAVPAGGAAQAAR